jgi:hypothetical protein
MSTVQAAVKIQFVEIDGFNSNKVRHLQAKDVGHLSAAPWFSARANRQARLLKKPS